MPGRISCHKIFIAHYEHVLAEPRSFIEPLAHFLELGEGEKTVRFVTVYAWMFHS